jgi:D-amino-acid dehydrogenase
MTASSTEGGERAGHRIAVVGAGIVGLCSARYLLDRGFEVEIFESREPRSACSFGNAGVLSSWSCVPLSMPGEWKLAPKWLLDPLGPLSLHWRYLPSVTPWLLKFVRAGRRDRILALSDAMFALNNPCVEHYRELLRGSGHENLIRDSTYLHVYRNPKHADMGAPGYRLRRRQGASVRLLDAAEIGDVEPAISREYRAGLMIENQGRTTNPERLCRVIADDVRRRGGTLTRAKVHALKPRDADGVALELGGKTRNFDKVVVATGAWSKQLVEPLGFRVPLESGRGYHIMFDTSAVGLNNSVVDNDLHFAASSMETGLRISGIMEFAGLDAPENQRRYSILAKLAARMIPGLDGDPHDCWMGHRPVIPDTLPVIGPLPGQPAVLLAFGHGQLGLTGAPMTGRIIASLAAGENPNIDLAPYRPDRFR